MMFTYLIGVLLASLVAAYLEKRWQLALVAIPLMFVMYINAYIYIEQFIKEIIFRKSDLTWFKPERVKFKTRSF